MSPDLLTLFIMKFVYSPELNIIDAILDKLEPESFLRLKGQLDAGNIDFGGIFSKFVNSYSYESIRKHLVYSYIKKSANILKIQEFKEILVHYPKLLRSKTLDLLIIHQNHTGLLDWFNIKGIKPTPRTRSNFIFLALQRREYITYGGESKKAFLTSLDYFKITDK